MNYKSTFVLFVVLAIAMLGATTVVSYAPQQAEAKPALVCYHSSVFGNFCQASHKACNEAYKNDDTADSKCKAV